MTRQELHDEAPHVWEYGSREQLTVDPPQRVFGRCVNGHGSLDAQETVWLDRPFVAELTDAKILPQTGVVTTDEHCIIVDSQEAVIP
jgi:hypothetical protein